MSDVREFNDPDTASSSGASQVPSQHLTIPSSRGMPRRDSGLPPFTRNTLGTPGKVFESLLLKKDHPQLSSKNSTNLASSSCGLRPETTRKTLVQEREVKREPLNSSIPVPRFPRGAGVLDILVELILTILVNSQNRSFLDRRVRSEQQLVAEPGHQHSTPPSRREARRVLTNELTN